MRKLFTPYNGVTPLKGVIFLMLMILLALPVISSGIDITQLSPSNDSTSSSGFVDFMFSINTTANVSLYINHTFNRSINLTSNGTFAFPSIIFPDGDYLWTLNATNHTTPSINGSSAIFLFSVGRLTGTLTKTECPVQSTATMLALWLIVIISLFFLAIGFTQKLGVIGFFGAIMFMVTSWFIAPCQPFFALICSLFSFLLIIWFVVRNLGMAE